MIAIKLDSEGENRRGRLRSYKAPVIRRLIILLSLVLILLANFTVFSVDASLSDKVQRGAIASVSIFLVVWFFASYRYTVTLGSFNETLHVINANVSVYTYTVTENGIVEKTDGKEKLYPYSSYVSVGGSEVERWIVFSGDLIYLPKYAIKSGSIEAFLSEFKARLPQAEKV